MTMSLRHLLAACSLPFTVAVAACGGPSVGVDGEVVGGACNADMVCAEGSQCITEGDFPDGMCTVSCDSDLDCPDGSFCISSEGGICMLPCQSKADCRPGYQCEGKSREAADGDVKVCNG